VMVLRWRSRHMSRRSAWLG